MPEGGIIDGITCRSSVVLLVIPKNVTDFYLVLLVLFWYLLESLVFIGITLVLLGATEEFIGIFLEFKHIFYEFLRWQNREFFKKSEHFAYIFPKLVNVSMKFYLLNVDSSYLVFGLSIYLKDSNLL